MSKQPSGVSMTNQEYENNFIARCRKEFGGLTPESEMLLRHGYSVAADEIRRIAFAEGVDAQRKRTLDVLGATPWKQEPLE